MQETVDKPKRSKTPYVLGCCGGGCLVVVIGVIGVIIWAVNFYNNLQEPTPSVTMQPIDQQKFSETTLRYDEYKAKVNSGQATPSDSFELTADEINNSLSKFLNDDDSPQVRVAINGDVATGEVSLPIKQDDGTKKWINGKAEFTVDVTGGVLDIRLKQLVVKGKPIPESIMDSLRKENLAKDQNENPELKRELEKVEKVEIKDGKVILKLKPQTPEPAAVTPEPEATGTPEVPTN